MPEEYFVSQIVHDLKYTMLTISFSILQALEHIYQFRMTGPQTIVVYGLIAILVIIIVIISIILLVGLYIHDPNRITTNETTTEEALTTLWA